MARTLHRTMFQTPLISGFLHRLSLLILRLLGWRAVGSLPSDIPKCVMIAAPHTSNWDLPYTLLTAFALRVDIYWMGKASLFKPPFRGLMMWMGGIPVERAESRNMVAVSVAAIEQSESLVLLVPPEGTRSGVTHWKTGFYWIAHNAGVPIMLGYLDFARREGGIGPAFRTTGDLDADMQEIRAFYATITGRKPTNYCR